MAGGEERVPGLEPGADRPGDQAGRDTAGTRGQFRGLLAEYAEYDSELQLRLSKSCETAPDDAIVHVGRVLEALLRDYWIRSPEVSGRPSRTANLDVLITKSLVSDHLEPIRVHAEVLQKMRNLAAHTGSAFVDEGDAADAVRRLLTILHWFRQQRRSLADAAGPAEAGHDHTPASAGQPAPPQMGAPARAVTADLPGTVHWEDSHPSLWEIPATGPWACVETGGRPFLVQAEGASAQLTDSRLTAKLAEGPLGKAITSLIVTGDGEALVVIAAGSLAWADYASQGRAPLRWVAARHPVGDATLLTGIRRKAGVELVASAANETYRLRVDTRGESTRSVLRPERVRSAALTGAGLVLVSKGGELELVNGPTAMLPDLPEAGWAAVDAALIGRDVGFAGLLDAEGARWLYAACPGRRFQVRVSDAAVRAQLCRSPSAGRSGVVVVESGNMLRAWRCDDLEPIRAAAAPSATGGHL